MNVEKSGYRNGSSPAVTFAKRTMARSSVPFDGAFWTLLLIVGCGFWFLPTGTPGETMKLTSVDFVDGGAIPRRHTCDGLDTPPQLGWSNVPDHAKSLAIIVDDPDAPDPAALGRTWTHWVMFNIPPDAQSLPEGARVAPPGADDGLNDWNEPGYRGPCPPKGRHRYFFRLFVLNTQLDGLNHPTREELLRAMAPYVVDKAVLVGTYERSRR